MPELRLTFTTVHDRVCRLYCLEGSVVGHKLAASCQNLCNEQVRATGIMLFLPTAVLDMLL